jgi:release factor glutamine methyltransferase
MTRAEAYAQAEQSLRAFGVTMSALEARYILCEAAEISQSSLLTSGDEPLNAAAQARFDDMLSRRLNHEPLARVLGHAEFWGMNLRVNPSVLDPRGDSETLIRAALELFGSKNGEDLKIIDLGTGSGALLCALLREFPKAFGLGVDLSEQAARTARLNATLVGVGMRAAFMVGRWGDALTGSFDIVMSNPPYIRAADIAGLDPSVRDYDPHLALDGGSDGLQPYRDLTAQLPRLLAPQGFVVFEIGHDQSADVQRMMMEAGLVNIRIWLDYAGHDRVVTGQSLA